jgi:hypothetical protein
MRKLMIASVSAIAIGFAFVPSAIATPAGPASIGEAATVSSPVVKAWWYRRHYWGWRGWRCNRWRCW